jgi:hypothetical protein
MNYDRGQLFYHYTTRCAAFGGILPSGELRFSQYSRMRDPLENQRPRPIGHYAIGSAGDLTGLVAANERFAEFDAAVARAWETTRLLALTEDAEKGYDGDAERFGRGWARARMWEQCAEQHRGVCLLFDRTKLRETILRSLAGQNLADACDKAVRYTPAGPRLPEVDMSALEHGDDDRVRDYIAANRETLFFIKTLDWEAEHEHRFVVTAPSDAHVSVRYDTSLVGVVLGERFPEWQLPSAIAACDAAHVNVAQMIWTSRPPQPRLLATTTA